MYFFCSYSPEERGGGGRSLCGYHAGSAVVGRRDLFIWLVMVGDAYLISCGLSSRSAEVPCVCVAIAPYVSNYYCFKEKTAIDNMLLLLLLLTAFSRD